MLHPCLAYWADVGRMFPNGAGDLETWKAGESDVLSACGRWRRIANGFRTGRLEQLNWFGAGEYSSWRDEASCCEGATFSWSSTSIFGVEGPSLGWTVECFLRSNNDSRLRTALSWTELEWGLCCAEASAEVVGNEPEDGTFSSP